jgi:hypothetical protein
MVPLGLPGKKNPLKDFMNNIELLEKNTLGKGVNPYTVNVISFNCHGFSYNNDAIAVLPIASKNSKAIIGYRFINVDDLALRLCQKANSLNILVLCMCRTMLSKNELDFISSYRKMPEQDYKELMAEFEETEEVSSEGSRFLYFVEDTMQKHREAEKLGCSVVLYAASEG